MGRDDRSLLKLTIGAAFLIPLSSAIYMPNIGNISGEFGYSYLIPMTVTGYVLAEALSYLVYGPLSDRYGRRRVYLPALYGFVISCILCYLSWDAGILVFFRLFQGLTVTTGFAVGSAVISDIYEPSVRGRAMGIFMAFPLAAPPVGFFLGGVIGRYLGWRYVFILLSVAGAIVAILFTLYFKETRVFLGEENIGIKTTALRTLEKPGFMSVTLLGVSLFSTLFAFLVFFSVRLDEFYGLDSFGIGLIFMAVALVDSVSAYYGGKLSDIYTRQKVFIYGSVLCVFGTILFAVTSGSHLIFPTMFYLVFAIGMGLSSAPLITYALETSPTSTGMASGIYNFVRSSGAGLLTFIGYFIIREFSFSVLFILCGLWMTVSILFTISKSNE